MRDAHGTESNAPGAARASATAAGAQPAASAYLAAYTRTEAARALERRGWTRVAAPERRRVTGEVLRASTALRWTESGGGRPSGRQRSRVERVMMRSRSALVLPLSRTCAELQAETGRAYGRGGRGVRARAGPKDRTPLPFRRSREGCAPGGPRTRSRRPQAVSWPVAQGARRSWARLYRALLRAQPGPERSAGTRPELKFQVPRSRCPGATARERRHEHR